ncbi:unnamed protein product [Cylicocyclus nassatus]|uniref:Solute carrier family 13 member 3 n=1 Tax=Cylicocyclus nassatus TaxID=53992 RepID=A0AA36GXW1_CYLNA|nr:unnamed protein product [Cylicocyclus nassatus]
MVNLVRPNMKAMKGQTSVKGSMHWMKYLLRDIKTYFKTIWIFVAPMLLLPLALLTGREGRCAYCIFLISCYWVAEVVPLAVTALLPVVLMPALSVAPIQKIARAYLSETNMMFLSTLMLSLAVEECQLHKRFALKMLTLVGARPQWLLAGFMCITTFISLWISDTACAALMSPIAFALLESMMIHKMTPSQNTSKKTNDLELEDSAGRETKYTPQSLEFSRLPKRDRGICKCLMLIVAHASLIGGTGTINSTAPNLIFRSTLFEYFPGEDTGITYLSWMTFAIPPMIACMMASWLIVQLQFVGLHHVLGVFAKPTEEEKADERRVRKTVETAYSELGAITFGEISTLVIFTLTIFSWITRDPKVIQGWAIFFKHGYVTDACTGILAVFILFIWPREMPDFFFLRPKSERNRFPIKRDAILTWDAVRRRFPWSVILLLGSGFAVAESVKESGLSSLLACQLQSLLSNLPQAVMQIIISIAAVTISGFTTNTATASIVIPIVFDVAIRMQIHPLYLSLAAAIGPSYSFMFPMSSPPNAIVYDTGAVSMMDMASSGLLLNIACILITVVNLNTWSYWLFSMNTYPGYALRYNSTSRCAL